MSNQEIFTETVNGVDIEANNLNINCLTSKQNKFHLDSDGNLSVNTLTVLNGTNNNSINIADAVYPIGSIYMSVNESNPATLFGGIWVQLKDRFLLGAGDTYTNGATAGESTCTLTVEEIPSHNHAMNSNGIHTHGVQGYWRSYDTTATAKVISYEKVSDDTASSSTPVLSSGSHKHTILNTGGGIAHNNMPPYLVVYMWKRTA